MPRLRSASFLFSAILILAAAAWIYGPALRGGWVWDDALETAQNSILRDPRGLAKIWAGVGTPDYFPLKTSVQWFWWQAWGDRPAAFHALSIGLHVACAFLFWGLLGKLGVRHAWLGGLLWVVHPLVVESVAWNAELKNVLSLAFLLGAMRAYLDYDQAAAPDRRRHYLESLLWFLLALLSKSSVVMLPFTLLLYAWWRRGRLEPKDLVAAAPFFGLSLFLGIVTIFFQYYRALAVWTIPVGGLASRLAVAGTSLSFYLGKSLWPFGLHPMYRQWSVNPPTAAQFLPWLGWALLFAWAWSRRAGWGRAVLFGGGFFALNLLPVLGFVPMSYMHISWVADHFAYLPLLGVIGLAVAAVDALWNRLAAKSGLRVLAATLAGGVIVLLAAASRGDAAFFRDDAALWVHTLEKNPEAWMAHIDLGRDDFEAGQVPEAIAEYGRALRIREDLPEAYYNRGSAWLRLGRLSEARTDLERALQLQPGSPDAETNLGNVLARSGDFDAAIAHYESALRLQPEARDTRLNLAKAYFQAGNAKVGSRDFPAAVAAYQKALSAQPDFAQARANLGNVLFVSRRLPEAIAQYEEALRLNPEDARTRANLNLARRAAQTSAP